MADLIGERPGDISEFARVITERSKSKLETIKRYRCLACQWNVPSKPGLSCLGDHVRCNMERKPCSRLTLAMWKRLNLIEGVNEDLDYEMLCQLSLNTKKRKLEGMQVEVKAADVISRIHALNETAEKVLFLAPYSSPAAEIATEQLQIISDLRTKCIAAQKTPRQVMGSSVIARQEEVCGQLRSVCFCAAKSQINPARSYNSAVRSATTGSGSPIGPSRSPVVGTSPMN